MNIGLFFGSFNPIHVGHLIIANHILNETELQKIWFVLSPLNPHKSSRTLLNEYDRFHLVLKAVEQNTDMRASDIEFPCPNLLILYIPWRICVKNILLIPLISLWAVIVFKI